MTIQLVFFIAAILFGIVWYWRESKGNSLYRFINKIFNSQELQMKASNRKGFVYQQSFILRLVYVSVLFLVSFVVFQFIVPIQLSMISFFVSMIAGTLLGTYLATIIFKSTEIIEEQTDNIEGFVQETLDKGKDFVENLKEEEGAVDEVKTIESAKEEVSQEKSARERLKDKGLL